MLANAAVAIAIGASPAENWVGRLVTVSRIRADAGPIDPYDQFLGDKTIVIKNRFEAIDSVPSVDPVIRNLVRMGRSAIPSLLKHLDDARPTRLVVRFNPGTAWFSNHYDPKERSIAERIAYYLVEPQQGPQDHIELEPCPGFSYSLRVGDLCFMILGQIVARHYPPLTYEWSGGTIIDSPIHSKDVRQRAWADWAGITDRALEDSLERDVISNHPPGIDIDSLYRLRFYYPAYAISFAAEILRKPIRRFTNSYWGAERFVTDTKQPWWPATLKQLKEKDDPTDVRLIALFLAQRVIYERDPKTRAAIRATLNLYFPDFHWDGSQFRIANDPTSVRYVIQAMDGLTSPDFDAAVTDAFQRAAALPVQGYDSYDLTDSIALDCVHRLGAKEPFLSYLQKRAAQTEPAPGWVTVPQRMKEIQAAVRKAGNAHP